MLRFWEQCGFGVVIFLVGDVFIDGLGYIGMVFGGGVQSMCDGINMMLVEICLVVVWVTGAGVAAPYVMVDFLELLGVEVMVFCCVLVI